MSRRHAVRPVVRALDPRWRAVRVGAFGGASLLLATAAHTLGGGALPAPGLLAVIGLLLGLVAVPLTVRRCRLPLLLGVLALEQVALHLVFVAAAGSAVCVPGGSHHAAAACGPSAAGSGHALGHGSWPMVVAHLVALLATAWLVARGERWLWRFADRLVAAAGPVRPSFRSRLAALVVAAPTAAVRRLVAAPLPARGPPIPV